MIEQYKILKKIRETSSNNEKQEILESHKNDLLLKEILEFVYNPYFRTGLSSKKINKVIPQVEYRLLLNESDSISYIFKYLRDNNTGTDKDIAQVQWYIRNYSEGESEIVKEILTQNLKIGMTAKSINKVWNNLIPEFDVMLAEKYWEKVDKLEIDTPEIIITQKLDGQRLCIIKDNGKIDMMTRNGQTVTGLIEIENEIKQLPDGVYDGELMLDNINNLPSKTLFTETIKVTRKDGDKTGIIFHVFDYISSVSQFISGTFNEKCKERKQALIEIISNKCQHIKYVPIQYQGAYDSKIVDTLLDKAISLEQEGLMINLANAPYSKKRTSDILKVKKMYTMDLVVTGVFEGKGKYKNTLGGVYVDFKGNNVGVGSGFTDDERKFIWEDTTRIVGQIVEVQYFEISKDSKTGLESLRFPIYKGTRLDKGEISFS